MKAFLVLSIFLLISSAIANQKRQLINDGESTPEMMAFQSGDNVDLSINPIYYSVGGMPGGSSGVLAGGLSPIKLNDKNLVKAVKYTIRNMGSETSTVNRKRWQLVRIVSATSQIVAGVKYQVTYRVKDANCKTSCPIHECNADIVVQSWLNSIRPTVTSCKKLKGKRPFFTIQLDSQDHIKL